MRTILLDRSIYLFVTMMLTLVFYNTFIENGYLMTLVDNNPITLNIFVITGISLSLLKLTGLVDQENRIGDPMLIGFGAISLVYYLSALSMNVIAT